MTFVATESCIQCKYTDCVSVCPMDCFVEGPNFFAINPDECIDCSMCVAKCPVGAIVSEAAITDDQRPFVQLNRDLSRRPDWQRTKPPLAEHERWAKVKDKRDLLLLRREEDSQACTPP